jgi:glycosyltransferase involved in cell wall biosynthesis
VEKDYQVTLASFIRPDEEEYIPFVKGFCSAFYGIPIRRSRAMDGLSWGRSILTGRPFLIERDDLSEMRALVNHLVKTEQIDAIHADQLTMTQFAFPDKFLQILSSDGNGKTRRAMRIFDAHNAVWTIVGRMTQNVPGYIRPLLSIESRRIKYYEGMLISGFDHTLAVTEPDRLALLEAMAAYEKRDARHSEITRNTTHTENKISVIPITVDTDHIKPVKRNPDSHHIFTLGTLHYPPNADGVRWFAREVFPLIQEKAPEVSLTITGKNPPPDIVELSAGNLNRIEVTGYIPDLRPYLERSAIMVVPVRAGSGMRVRILEAFARGIPVVTTSIGLEGIEAIPGLDVLVADTPQDFAAAVIQIMNDDSLQRQLAERGRRLVEGHYDWRVALKRLGDVYDQLAGK